MGVLWRARLPVLRKVPQPTFAVVFPTVSLREGRQSLMYLKRPRVSIQSFAPPVGREICISLIEDNAVHPRSVRRNGMEFGARTRI